MKEENKVNEVEAQRPVHKSRKDRRVLDEANRFMDDLVKVYHKTRALHGTDTDKMVSTLNKLDAQWKRYVTNFNKAKKGWRLDPDTLLNTLASTEDMEKALGDVQKRVLENAQYKRWKDIQKEYNWWAWLYDILEWAWQKVFKTSYWWKRYESSKA